MTLIGQRALKMQGEQARIEKYKKVGQCGMLKAGQDIATGAVDLMVRQAKFETLYFQIENG
jgi:hypothetical protein